MVSRILCKTDLNLFVVFDAIYEEGSITRAAEVLNVTQPAVSNNIARLREMFNDPLFVRVKRGVSPTPLARDLIGPVKQALKIFEATFKKLEAFDPKTSDRTIRISTGDLSEVIILSPLVQAIRAQGSGINVHNFLLPRNKLPLKLASGEVDFAIDTVRLNDSNLHSERIVSDEFVCVVRKGHPLAKGKLSTEDYVSLDHIQVSSRPSGAGIIDMVLSKMKRRRRIAVRVQHYLMTPQLVKDSDMAITIPKLFAKQIIGEQDFSFLQLPFDTPPLELWLHWHTNTDENPLNNWIRELLFELGD